MARAGQMTAAIYVLIFSVVMLSACLDKQALAATVTPAPVVENVCAGQPPTGTAPSAGGVAAAPLIVTDVSHIVVLEYEAWFGPDTGMHPQASVTTCLQTQNMRALGGGYDSAAPGVISQHVAWLEQMGVDAVTLDLSNDVPCIFDGDNPQIIHEVCPNRLFHAELLAIRNNDGNLYGAWTHLGTRLKIVPLLGGFGADALTPDEQDPRHRSALEKEVDYFGGLMAAYPDLSVVYMGKPMMLIYMGAPVDPARVSVIRAMLQKTKLDQIYTFRIVGGYLDSQPMFWADPGMTPSGPIKIAPRYGFWSVVDRLNFWGAPPAPYYPTYNVVGDRVENITASIATEGQSGWTCPTKTGNSYCPDAALRYCGTGFQNGCQTGHYETFAEFMTYAAQLQPIFLILNQFNEFATPDEGPDANTNNDIEPTRQWGYFGLDAVITAITEYRTCCGL
jgi:hypothetical protein